MTASLSSPPVPPFPGAVVIRRSRWEVQDQLALYQHCWLLTRLSIRTSVEAGRSTVTYSGKGPRFFLQLPETPDAETPCEVLTVEAEFVSENVAQEFARWVLEENFVPPPPHAPTGGTPHVK